MLTGKEGEEGTDVASTEEGGWKKKKKINHINSDIHLMLSSYDLVNLNAKQWPAMAAYERAIRKNR